MNAERNARAEARRQTATIVRTRLGDEATADNSACGAAAISLVTRLTLSAWALSGRELPRYSRGETPFRFVPNERG